MIKLVVLYTQPDDPATFDKHYLEIHGPLALKVPGVERFESSLLVSTPDGTELTYHRMAELHFTDGAAMQAALASDEGKAMAADFAAIAPPGSRMFVAALD